MKAIAFNYQVKIDNKLIKVANEVATGKTVKIALDKMHERKGTIEQQYKKLFPRYMQVSCEINKITEVSK